MFHLYYNTIIEIITDLNKIKSVTIRFNVKEEKGRSTMGIIYEDMNFDRVVTDLGNACLTEASCGGCDKSTCIIGYAQKCIGSCLKNNVTYVENGSEQIPLTDFKMYNEEELEKGIAHILKQCKSCQLNHFDNCIINLVRNCYEVGLFGEIQPYEGSNFRYLNQINTAHPDHASNIIEEFHATED